MRPAQPVGSVYNDLNSQASNVAVAWEALRRNSLGQEAEQPQLEGELKEDGTHWLEGAYQKTLVEEVEACC